MSNGLGKSVLRPTTPRAIRALSDSERRVCMVNALVESGCASVFRIAPSAKEHTTQMCSLRRMVPLGRTYFEGFDDDSVKGVGPPTEPPGGTCSRRRASHTLLVISPR